MKSDFSSGIKNSGAEIFELSDRDHVLKRPGIYIGSISPTKASTFIYDGNSGLFEYRPVEYVPGFLKIIYEILDNSVDEAVRTDFKKAIRISVSIDRVKGICTISDDGRGIPLDPMAGSSSGKSQMEAALTGLRTGSNFDDEAGRVLLGQNGVGAALTNIFSSEFKAVVLDGRRRGILKCSGNMSKVSCEIVPKESQKTGTEISFRPDFQRFGLSGFDDNHIALLKQRLFVLAFMYPEITFKLDGKPVGHNIRKGQDFMKLFGPGAVFLEDKPGRKWLVGVVPNESGEFSHKSYINGADCILGGNHIDAVLGEFCPRLRDRLGKKCKGLKNSDIKSNISLVAVFREFKNPSFNSQSKENFSSPSAEILSYLSSADWDSLAKKAAASKEISGQVAAAFAAKTAAAETKALGKISAGKKFRCKKFMPATSERKYFFITEGDSAQGGLSDGLGRKQCGYFSTRGVPLNAYETDAGKISANEELTNIVKCLGVKIGKDGGDISKMTYDSIVLASDADSDGAHITMLYVAFFLKWCPEVIRSGRLKKLLTPIVCLKDKSGKIQEAFFTLDEYNGWLSKNSGSVRAKKLKEKYYKGLGSWEKGELGPLVQKLGEEKFIKTLALDDEAEQLVDDWMAKDKVPVRKEYLKQNEFSIFSI